MTLLLSGSIGVVLGVVHARLALIPLVTNPACLSPKAMVVRFVTRVIILLALLVVVTKAGAFPDVLLAFLVAGFTAQSALLLRRMSA